MDKLHKWEPCLLKYKAVHVFPADIAQRVFRNAAFISKNTITLV